MRLTQIALCALLCVSATLARDCTPYWTDVNNWARGASRDPVCPDQFEDYNFCLAEKVEAEVGNVIEESDPAAQDAVNTCFTDAGCSEIDFEETAALDTFLPCQYTDPQDVKDNCIWRHAANLIIDILKSTPKPVSQCMIRFFKGIGKRKIEQCTRQYPPPINPPFVQPTIPGFENFELEDLKNVLLYHVMTRFQLGKCTNCQASTRPGLVDCLAGQAKENIQDVCDIRQECEGPIQATCGSRFNDVRESICNCAAGELKKGLDALKNWKELKSVFTRGDLECQMEDCYIQEGEAGWEVMNDKLQQMKSAVLVTIVKVKTGDAPTAINEALVVFKYIFEELIDKWQGIFCGSCNTSRGSAVDIRRQALHSLLRSEGCEDATAEFDLTKLGNNGRFKFDSSEEDAIDDFFGKR